MQNEEILLNKMIMLLAGSGMTSQQIFLLLKTLKSTELSIILNRIEKYRGITFSNDIEITIAYEEDRFNDSVSPVLDKDALYSIERLIVKEAGLTKNLVGSCNIKFFKEASSIH